MKRNLSGLSRVFGDQTMAEAFVELRSGFDAARNSRFRSRRQHNLGMSADWHYRSDADYLRVMELARDFDRNDIVVGQAVDRLVDTVLQAGINPDPHTGDKGVDQELKDRWYEWAENPEACDLAGEDNFADKARMTLRAMIVDGDMQQLLTDDGSIETMEGHRLRTPTGTRRNVVHGVLLDESRRHLEYWFTREDVGTYGAVRRVSEIEARPARDEHGNRQVLHCYMPKRVSQTRGVSALAPAADAVGMHDDVQFATLVQRQIVSCFAVFREQTIKVPGGLGDLDTGHEERRGGREDTLAGVRPGMIISGQEGEKLHGFSPNIPNAEFFPHAKLILTFIAINLGLPVHVLLLDPSDTNFSGWRGAIDQARIGFRRIQRRLAGRLHDPVYRWKQRQWVYEDAMLRRHADRLGKMFWGAVWQPPRWQYIEPLKDAEADALRIEKRLDSARGVLAERGLDLDDVIEETITDNFAAITRAMDRAIEINENAQYSQRGMRVDWRELLSLSIPNAAFARSGNQQRDEQEAA